MPEIDPAVDVATEQSETPAHSGWGQWASRLVVGFVVVSLLTAGVSGIRRLFDRVPLDRLGGAWRSTSRSYGEYPNGVFFCLADDVGYLDLDDEAFVLDSISPISADVFEGTLVCQANGHILDRNAKLTRISDNEIELKFIREKSLLIVHLRRPRNDLDRSPLP